MNFKKKREINKISISLDKNLNENLEKENINKSKLINFLINEFFENDENEDVIKKFIKNENKNSK